MPIFGNQMPPKKRPALKDALHTKLRPFNKLDYTGFAGVEGDPYIGEWGTRWVIIHDIKEDYITIQAIDQVDNETINWELMVEGVQICPPES
jgi:hypothetical protein